MCAETQSTWLKMEEKVVWRRGEEMNYVRTDVSLREAEAWVCGNLPLGLCSDDGDDVLEGPSIIHTP